MKTTLFTPVRMLGFPALLLLLVSLPLRAGEVFGYIMDADENPVQGVSVAIVCGENQNHEATATTDKEGMYSLYVDYRGECNLLVGETPFVIEVLNDPVEYSFTQ